MDITSEVIFSIKLQITCMFTDLHSVVNVFSGEYLAVDDGYPGLRQRWPGNSRTGALLPPHTKGHLRRTQEGLWVSLQSVSGRRPLLPTQSRDVPFH